MKNKRTKLTALLLSALMAVSTISSVTWAADLFSDGNDIEVLIEDNDGDTVIEDPINVEEDDSSDDLYAEGGTIDESTIKCEVEYDSNTGSYSAHVTYYLSNDLTREKLIPEDFENIVPYKTDSGNCKNYPTMYFKLTLGGEGGLDYIAIYEQRDGWNPDEHHSYERKTLKTLLPAKCTLNGFSITYWVCTGCSMIKDLTKTVEPKVSSYNYEQIQSEAEALSFTTYSKTGDEDTADERAKYKELVENELQGKTIKGSKATTYLEVTTDPEWGHKWGEPKASYYPANSTAEEQKLYKEKANCVIDEKTGKLVGGYLDPTKDAFYFDVYTCQNPGCGEQKDNGRHYIHYGNITEGGKYYVAGEGVEGFVYYDDSNKLIDPPSRKIPESKFSGEDCVVLQNCNNGGVYYLVTYGTDGVSEINKEKFTIKAGHHTWGPYLFVINDGNNYKTVVWDEKGNTVSNEDNPYYNLSTPIKASGLSVKSDFAMNANGKPKIQNDKNGIPSLVSKTCNIPAYFELSRKCVSCQVNDTSEEIGGKRKALIGDHVWDENKRYLDPTQTQYIPIKDKDGNIDKEHHIEKYKDNVVCKYCGTKAVIDSETPEAVVDHKFEQKEIADTRKEANCGNTGSVDRAETCPCGFIDESTRTTVTIPATDKHDFGDSKPYLVWSGDVYIKDGGENVAHSIKISVGRKCTVCEKFDANGINDELPGKRIGGLPILLQTITVTPTREAKKDPATGIAYRCSQALATVEVNWVGTVNGKLVRLNKENTDDAVRENVPLYSDVAEYDARTAHTPGKPQKEGDWIITYCTVCGDIASKDPDTTPDVGVPTVSAASVDYDTVNVSWTKVDGATAYRLYFRSSDEGISKWQRIRTFTSDATSYQVNGLTTGSKYRFTVRAEITSEGETTLGDYSKTGAVAVPKLTAPEIKSVTESGKTTKVTWSRVDGASGYIVFRNSQRVGTVTKGSKVTWTDKKPVSGAKYQIRAYRTEDKKNYKSDLSVAK